jgi:hypothetical protein
MLITEAPAGWDVLLFRKSPMGVSKTIFPQLYQRCSPAHRDVETGFYNARRRRPIIGTGDMEARGRNVMVLCAARGGDGLDRAFVDVRRAAAP